MAMTEENWNRNINGVSAWMNKHAESEDEAMQGSIHTMNFFIGLGSKEGTDDKKRSSYWTAIRAAGDGYEDFPTSQRGKANNFTEEQNAVVISVEQTLRSVYASYTPEQREMVMEFDRPHGKTGGMWADYQAHVDYKVKNHMKLCTTQIKNKEWDGLTLRANGLPDLMPAPLNAKNTQSTEEVDEEE